MKKNQSGIAVLEAVLILVIVGIVAFTGWYVLRAKHNSNKSYANATAASQNTPAGSSSSQTTGGTDNASLQGDLNSVNASQSQEGSDNSTAASAVNDQQNEISVPTN